MSGSKHFDKIAWIAAVLMLVIVILFINGKSLGFDEQDNTAEYADLLFDHSKVHTINIEMDKWDEFIENATSEEYYNADVTIDGEEYPYVAIRGKGNTSLSTVASMDSDRYSFKLEFDHYNDGLSYHGLDKLSLNNLIQDSTMMKDYLSYTMMNDFGVASSLCSFVYITVNGEDWGLYLAVEGVEESFLERNYGTDYGNLYKPDSMSFGGGRGNGKDFYMDEIMNSDEDDGDSTATSQTQESTDKSGTSPQQAPSGSDSFIPQSPQGSNNTSQEQPQGSDNAMPSASAESGKEAGFGGGGGMSSSDVKLQYIDDLISSYSNIWDNAKTDITKTDKTRLIESLKKLSSAEDLDSVVDIDQVIRYFVVHNYVCNGDSYTGSMVHNYYLYEKDGKMSMIPWDYNLAFGTFMGGNGQSTINTPIDSPVSNESSEDRPMWNWILSDESYTQQYHDLYSEFLNSVDIEGIIDRAYELISPYVEKDPTAFYTYDEFQKGVETMKQYCSLRSESIKLQLENGETTSDMSYVDASGISLSDMGSMGGGGGMTMPDTSNKADNNATSDMPEGDAPSQNSGDSQSSTENSNGSQQATGGGNMPTPPDGANGGQTPPTGTASPQGENGGFEGGGNMPTPPDGANGGQTPPTGSPSPQGGSEAGGGNVNTSTSDGWTPDQNQDGGQTLNSDNSGVGPMNPSTSDNFQAGGDKANFDNKGNSGFNSKTLILIIAMIILLTSGIILAKFYRR